MSKPTIYTVFPDDPSRLPQDFDTMQEAIEYAEEYEPGDYTIACTI